VRYLVFIAVVVGITFAGCGAPADDGNTSSGDSSTGAEWIVNDFDAASALAAEEGKPLLMDLYADWCGPCVTLGEDYFPSEELQPVLSNFVLVKIDVDSPSGGPVADRYNVSSIPTVIIAHADGTEIERIVGITPTATQYAAALQEIVDKM